MKTLLQKLTGAGRVGLLSPALFLLYGNPAQPTSDLLEIGCNLPVIASMVGCDKLATQKTEHPFSTGAIRQNKEKLQFTSRIFPTQTPGCSPKIEYRFKKPESWGISISARLINNSQEYVYSGYRPYWSFYWTRDTRYKT